MQASKIKIGGVYAIKRDDKLVEFRVTAVTTRRHGATGSPHDYTSTVEGRLFDKPVGQGSTQLTLKPDELLGPYEDYKELVAKREAEEAAKKADEKKRADLAYTTALLLYEALGIPVPPEDTSGSRYRRGGIQSYDAPIRHSERAYDFTVHEAAMQPLHDLLAELLKKREAA